eukprot:1247852-Prymnesium_polylepis.1
MVAVTPAAKTAAAAATPAAVTGRGLQTQLLLGFVVKFAPGFLHAKSPVGRDSVKLCRKICARFLARQKPGRP